MKRRTGCIWMAAGIALALLAGGLIYVILLRVARLGPIAPPEPRLTVVVAREPIQVRQLIEATDVQTQTVPVDMAPGAAVRDPGEVIGRLARHDIGVGEILLTTDVVSPTVSGGDLAITMDQDKVAMAVPAQDLINRMKLLKPGDHVDVLFSFEIEDSVRTGIPEEDEDEEDKKSLVTVYALQNLEIGAIVRPGEDLASASTAVQHAEAAIVFALDPKDALVFKHLLDRGGIVDMVLRAPGATELFEVQPGDSFYLVDRYKLHLLEQP